MARLRKKLLYDAGVTNDPKANLPELNDQDGHGSVDIPKSTYAIRETVDLVFTNRIIEKYGKRMSFADGDVRPGTTR